MGKKPWLISTVVLGFGVVFTGCNTTPTKDTSTFKGGGKDVTLSRNSATTNPTPGSQPQTPLPGQTAAVSTSSVADPHPIGMDSTTPFQSQPTQPVLGDSRMSTTSIQPAAGNSLQVVPPPQPSTLPPSVTNKPFSSEAPIHSVPGTSMHQDDLDSRSMPQDGSPNALPGTPLPAINTGSPSSSALPSVPAPALQTSSTPNFGTPPPVSLPPMGASIPMPPAPGTTSTSVPPLPPIPIR
jgi:hypothetical protein